MRLSHEDGFKRIRSRLVLRSHGEEFEFLNSLHVFICTCICRCVLYVCMCSGPLQMFWVIYCSPFTEDLRFSILWCIGDMRLFCLEFYSVSQAPLTRVVYFMMLSFNSHLRSEQPFWSITVRSYSPWNAWRSTLNNFNVQRQLCSADRVLDKL